MAQKLPVYLMEHSMPVWIDTEDRVGTCSVTGQGRAPVIDAYIDDSASGVCVNVGLEYPAKDKCGKVLAVKLNVCSNELKDFKPVDVDVSPCRVEKNSSSAQCGNL